MNPIKILLILSLLFIMLMTGCAQAITPPPPAVTDVPPTATNTALPQPTQTASPTATSAPLPTIQAGCTDSALFVEDVSIPDNVRLKAGESFTKIWRLRNTGTCIWNIRYALVFVGGECSSPRYFPKILPGTYSREYHRENGCQSPCQLAG